MNLSINFRGLPFNAKMAPSWLKQINFVLSEFMLGPVPLPACFMLGSRDVAWVGVLVRSARLSM